MRPSWSSSPVVIIAVLLGNAADAGDLIDTPRLDEILSLHLSTGAPYRLERVSDQVVFGKFASAEARAAVLGRLDPKKLEGSWAGPALTLTDTSVEWTLSAPDLSEAEAEFRDRLAEIGLLPVSGGRQVLITLVESGQPADLFDFSDAERLAARQREADLLDQGRSSDPQLDVRLGTRFGASLAAQALRDAEWKFDDLPEVTAEARQREAERRQLVTAQRARFLSEAVRALYWVDPSYESSIIEWVEGLPQEDTNRLVQLLQIAGYQEMSPEILVREGAPHLHQPSVLTARLYQRLEAVTTGGSSKRQLDPEQFADPQVLERAQAFYEGFFVADRRGRFEFQLTEEVEDFIQSQSALVRELTSPHLEALLGRESELPAD